MAQRRAQITGWGKCVPPVKLTNADLEQLVDTDDQWITERTGMKERGISHVEVTDLAEVAAHHASEHRSTRGTLATACARSDAGSPLRPTPPPTTTMSGVTIQARLAIPMPTARIVAESNARCDQENIFAQGKQMGALSAPLHDLTSNWAYMVIGMLAWNLKCWLGLTLKVAGNATAREKRQEYKKRLLRMDFSTFRQQLIQVPAQILTKGHQLICRLLTWTPSVELMFLLHESTRLPLRH